MKKLNLTSLLGFLAMLFLAYSFTSCSSDDNNEEENYSPDGENSNNGKMLSGVIDGHEAVD